jgi:hypothetical protein
MYSRRYELTSDQLPTEEALKAAGPVGSSARFNFDKTFWTNTITVAHAFRDKYLQGTGLELKIFDVSYCFFVTGDEDKVTALPNEAAGCKSVSIAVGRGIHDNRD